LKPLRSRLVRLPDSTAVWTTSPFEAAVLYHELGKDAVYLRHGVQVHDGDCVFDVGANIGLYSVLLLRAYRGLRLFAFEPVPFVYTLLERNLALYRGDACVTSFNCALGREAGTAEGLIDLGFSFAASLRPADVAGAVRPGTSQLDWVRALILDFERLGLLSPLWARRLKQGLESSLRRPLVVTTVLALATYVRLSAGGWLRKRRFACHMRSLSEVILEHNVSRIDMLKIDVEGSECDVLSGLESVLWPRVRQAVVEVHDVAGRVDGVGRLFREHGFHTAVDQEDWAVHRLLGIYTICARRDR
jgi:hypothetical protein